MEKRKASHPQKPRATSHVSVVHYKFGASGVRGSIDAPACADLVAMLAMGGRVRGGALGHAPWRQSCNCM